MASPLTRNGCALLASTHFRKNEQAAATAEMPNDPVHVCRVEGDAPGRRIARAPPSMNEYCGSSVRHGVRPVVSDHHEQIVKIVGSGKPLMAEIASRPAVRQLVVILVSRIIAPDLPTPDRSAFHGVACRVYPIRPEVNPMQAECAGRRAAVAFDF